MLLMTTIIYFFSGLFLLLAVAIVAAYFRTRHAGFLLIGITYAASAGLALLKMQWWPLLAGFALVWMLRWMGMEPDNDVAAKLAAMRSQAVKDE